MKSSFYRPAVLFLLVGAAGTALALLNAGVWLNYVSVPGSPYAAWTLALRGITWALAIVVALGTVGAILTTSGGSALSRATSLLRTIIGIAFGCAIFWLLRSSTMQWAYSDTKTLIGVSFGLAVCAALLAWVFGGCNECAKRRALRLGIAILFGWPAAVYAMRSDLFGGSHSLGGIGTVLVLRQPLDSQQPLSAVPELVSGILAGLIIGAAVAGALGLRIRRGAASGALAGLAAAAVCYAVQTRTLAETLKTTYSENHTFLAAFWLGAAAAWIFALAVGLAAAALDSATVRETRRGAGMLAAIILLSHVGLSVWQIRTAFAGHDLLARALDLPQDGQRVYLQLSGGRAWVRSAERKPSPEIVRLCDRLIRKLPRSCYRPAAMYLKASAQFDDWDFAASAATLEQLRSEYPAVKGANSILLFLSYVALGDYRSAAMADRSDWLLAQWLETDGSQIMAAMWERLGRFADASGAYSLYADFVRAKMGWGAAARALATSAELSRRAPVRLSHSRVQGRVFVGDGPAAGVIVALVQPRIDASSLSESQQFVGARTLPLWGGISAKTDSQGVFRLRSVVPGDYQVVLGFDRASVPVGYVLASAIGSVSIKGQTVRLGDIRFVPRLALLGPTDGTSSATVQSIRWSPLPDAETYSVVILSLPSSQTGVGAARTCWTKAGLRENRAALTADGFVPSSEEATQRRLIPGRTYLCWVYAYDSSGRLLTSSEDYYDSGLDSFKVPSR